jgi:hypothetical protein
MTTTTLSKKLSVTGVGAAFIGLGTILAQPASAISLATPFNTSYSVTNLGSVPELPTPYVGLTFKTGNPNTLLIGGTADSKDGKIFSIGVTRDRDNHITGFTGKATFFADAFGIGNGVIDAGLTFGPDNVLFYTTYPDNSVGQIKPGSTSPDKQINLTPLGFESSVGGLAFVPLGFPGAGRLKITSYDKGIFYDTTVSADGTSTFDIAPPTKGILIGGGPDAFVYVAASNPQFTADSLLVAEIDNARVSAYAVDANGDPITASRQDFLTDIGGVIGAAIDPLTGDILFSTYSDAIFNPGGDNQVVVVKRSATSVPEPASALGLLAMGMIGVGKVLKKKLVPSKN